MGKTRHSKIVFLDCDGVLNSVDWWHNRYVHQTGALFWFNITDPLTLARLDRLCASARAKLVFSSSLRGGSLRRLNAEFKALGLKERFVGQTPALERLANGRRQPRGAEIRAWLNQHDPVAAFVILDDEADMGELLPRLVQTDHLVGLTDADVDRAIIMLNTFAEGNNDATT